MKESLRLLFNIYKGEERNALKFALLGFLWSLGVSLGWKNADALFLLNVGADHLPTAYGIIAGFMIAIASVMLYAYNEFAVHKIFLTVLSVGIAFYSAIFVFLEMGIGQDSKWLWYALRVFGWIFFSVVNTNFWTLIDQFYHLSDSKRLFTLFSSSVFVGVAFTGIIMNLGLFEFQQVTLLIITILFLTWCWTFFSMKNVERIHSEQDLDAAVSPSDQTLKQTLLSVLSSKFTLCLMTLNFISYVSLFLTEFNYMQSFENFFGGGYEMPIENEEDAPLTIFLGKCIAFVNIFNILFGLFVYSRLVRKFGVNALILVTPAILVMTYLGWPFSQSLLFPLMAYFVCESTYYVLDDNNFNLLLNAVPSKLKYKIRVCIESFFEPVGTLVCAILLTLFPHNSHLLALIVALVMLCLGIAARWLYPKAVYNNLQENAIHFEKTPKQWLADLSKKERKLSESQLLEILQFNHPQANDFALEGLLDIEDTTIIEKLLNALDQCSASIKEVFIKKLEHSSFARDSRILDRLLLWDEIDQGVSFHGTLHLFLAKLGLLSPQKAFQDLKSPDPKLQCAAIIALKKSAAYSNSLSTTDLRTLASQYLKEWLSRDDENSVLMGLTVLSVDAKSEDINLFIPYLKNPSQLIARFAAKNIAKLASPQAAHHSRLFIDALETLSDNECRLALIEALGKIGDTSLISEILEASYHLRPNERRLLEREIYKMGLRNVPTLLSLVKDDALPHRNRLLAGRVLGQLALPQLKANLLELISHEIERASFYFYHAHTIQQDYPKDNLTVLKDTLLSSYFSVLDFIIQMLGIAGEVEDSELLSRSLRSHNPKIRGQVIETLERTCDRSLFRLLEPLVDERPLSQKLQYTSDHKLKLQDLLIKLKTSSSLVDQIAAAALSAILHLPNWRDSLKKQMIDNKEEIFQHFAYELLDENPNPN